MFGDLVKQDFVANTSLATFTPDLGSNPASGNLLIATVCAGSSAAVLDTPPSGFTLLHSSTTGSGTWHWFYKISVGTEQTISATWDIAVNGVMRYVEYEWDGSVPIVTKDQNTDNISVASNAQPSGSVTPTKAKNICLAMHATDGNRNSLNGQFVSGGGGFPTVADVGVFVNGAAQSNHSANYPATVTAGQLLLYFVGCDGSGDTPTITGVTGINLLFSGSHINHGSAVYWKLADGTEGGTTFNVAITSVESCIAYCFAVDGWESNTAPEISTTATGDSTTPDPDSITPSWGVENTLYVAFATRDTGAVHVSYPTNYDDNQNADNTSSNAAAIATREIAGSPENPGTFTFDLTETWAAFTIAVRPDSIWTEDNTFLDNDVNQGEGKLSRLVNAPLSAQEVTHEDVDVGDQMFGAIAVFDVPNVSIRSSAKAANASASSITVNEPTGAAIDDWLIVVVVANQVVTLSDGNGSTPFIKTSEENEATNGSTIAVFQRKKESGDPSTFTFNSTATDRISAIAIALRDGATGNDPYDVTPSATTHDTELTTTTHDCLDITTLGDFAIHLAVSTFDSGASSFNLFPSGYTVVETEDGTGQGLSIYSKVISPAGATGAQTFGSSGTLSFQSQSFSIANVAAAGGGTKSFTSTVTRHSLHAGPRNPYGSFAGKEVSNNASGAPSITNITSTGVAEIEKIASGAPSITGIISTGIAEIIKPASGAPSILKPTSTGISAIKFTASDAVPSIIKPTSTGVAEIEKIASGSPAIPSVISTGVAEIEKIASGSPSITQITSVGVAAFNWVASGSPSIENVTSIGSAVAGKIASGAPAITKPTSTGVTEIEKIASGAPSITKPISTGVAEIIKPASGAPSITNLTSTGVSAIKFTASDAAPSILKPTSTGVAEIEKQASGAPSITNITSTGSSFVTRDASGAPSITNITSTGVATVSGGTTKTFSVAFTRHALYGGARPLYGAFTKEQINTASGAPSITNITSTGVAVIEKIASGSPAITKPTSTGVAEIEKIASGAPSITKPISTGVAALKWVASGAPSITNITSTGVAGVKRSAFGSPSITNILSTGVAEIEKIASGSPSIVKPTATGTTKLTKFASGSPSITKPTSTGTAVKADKVASGAPSITPVTASGVAEIIKIATGTPSIPKPTSSGVAVISRSASGAPSITTITSVGVAVIEKIASDAAPAITKITSTGISEVKKVASGAPSINPITSLGSGTIVKIASGVPAITKPTTAGNANVTGTVIASGAPSITKPFSLGTARIGFFASGSPAISRLTSSSIGIVNPVEDEFICRILAVPFEDRALSVSVEDRLVVVVSEDRSQIVAAEDRTHAIECET